VRQAAAHVHVIHVMEAAPRVMEAAPRVMEAAPRVMEAATPCG
jgi:hypothetical protein